MAGDCEDAPRFSPIPDSPPADTAPKACCVVDFKPDDDEWEDKDTQLQGLGTTTHRSRNRTRPVIPIRKHRCIVRGTNSHATVEARAKSSGSRKSLAADLATWEVEREERVQELTDRHSMKVKEVRRQMLSTSAFKPMRKVSLYNAKIVCIMAGLNEAFHTDDYVTQWPSFCMKIANCHFSAFVDEAVRHIDEGELIDEEDIRRAMWPDTLAYTAAL
ncbi:hypothetical protein DFH09DRAFT_1096978 [Mycena vulgaris]|nr:hypothetical protein DFH09DRAFT_1096978 [Mycena vulgaris]